MRMRLFPVIPFLIYASSINYNSEYLFDNPKLIPKSSLREGLGISSRSINVPLGKKARGELYLFKSKPPLTSFVHYIKDNYSDFFCREYKIYEADLPGREFSRKLNAKIWKKMCDDMLSLTSTSKTINDAFEKLFGLFEGPANESVYAMLKTFKTHILNDKSVYPFGILEAIANLTELKFIMMFAYLIFKHLGPSNAYQPFEWG